MAAYFETAKSFSDVPITEDGVDTASFLEASSEFLHMFDLVGGSIFVYVQSDLRANLAGVRAQYEKVPSESTTLEKLVICEAQHHQSKATDCLVGLMRGLLFTCKALEIMQSDRSLELSACFRQSYNDVLRPLHSFLVRSAVYLVILTIPRRRDFYDRITQGASHEMFDAVLAKWLAGLERIIDRVKTFLEEGGYGRV